MTSFSIIFIVEKKVQEKLSKVLNTFENIMENGAFAPRSKYSIFHNTFKYIVYFKGVIMEERVN